jgi:hypothetical protein
LQAGNVIGLILGQCFREVVPDPKFFRQVPCGAMVIAGDDVKRQPPLPEFPDNAFRLRTDRRLKFEHARPLYSTSYLNFAPRLALAYSPDAPWLGGPGKTTFRAGAGVFYDLFGRGILSLYEGARKPCQEPRLYSDSGNCSPVHVVTDIRRSHSSSHACNISLHNNKYNFGSAIDDQIKPPYTINLDFAVNHDFGRGLSLQAAYVGRLSRRSLALTDLASPTNLRDPQSGQTYFQAAQQIVGLLQANTPINKVQSIPFWQNLWPGAAGQGLTATQGIYQTFQKHVFGSSANDYSDVLAGLDGYCVPACSALGPNAMFNPGSDKQNLQFRAEAYNLTNSVRFDVNSLYLSAFNLGPTALTFTNPNFGKYSSALTTPRQIQFALRYMF